jgi:hypothetical protein
MDILILVFAGVIAARLAWAAWRRRNRRPIVVLGAEMARARAAEQARERQASVPSV